MSVDITKLRNYSYIKLNEQFDELQELLNEYEDIAKFFELLTLRFYSPIPKYSKETRTNIEYVASDALASFVWQIWPSLDIGSALLNSYHFDGSWVANLNSFMVNVFLDDSAFSIKREYSEWCCGPPTDDNWHQDPKILIAAAYDMARYWIEVEDQENGLPKLEVIKRGMVSSGEVEKLLKEK